MTGNSAVRPVWRVAVALAIASSGSLLGCTDVTVCEVVCTDPATCADPCSPAPAQPPDNVIAVQGQTCTTDPSAVLFPYKLLFVIDVSGSNTDSDPGNKRAAAVEQVISEYIENRALTYAVVRFNNEPAKITATFTRDEKILLPGAVDALRMAEQATNYLDTLSLVYDMIKEDAESMSPTLLARTRYDVQWLSDGIPAPCQEPSAIESATDRVMSLRDELGMYDLRISTTQLDYADTSGFGGCPGTTPIDYLKPMAEHGKGTYQSLTADGLRFKIAFSEIFRRFVKRQFFVVNHSRVVQGDELLPDSDQDGVADRDESKGPERAAVSKEVAAVCNERITQELAPSEGVCIDICTRAVEDGDGSMPDSDGDTLPDCAEKALGYFSSSSDTDMDGFYDGLELRFATAVVSYDTITADSDIDGKTDADEIRSGTNPLIPDADDKLAYVYSPLRSVMVDADLDGIHDLEGSTCYDFGIDNIRLVHTQATATTQEGDNLVCMYLVQQPVEQPDQEPTITRACKTVRYLHGLDYDLKEPANGRLTFTPTDFSIFVCPGGGCIER